MAPYRLRAAQDAALTFADEVPRQYQVGLVSFSGQANLLVAPTTDRAALRRAIEGLTPDGATAVGEAIVSLARRDPHRAERRRRGHGRSSRRASWCSPTARRRSASPRSRPPQDAKEAGVPIYTVALGTADGVLSNGQPVPPDPQG